MNRQAECAAVYADHPGCRVCKDGIIFSAVMRGEKSDCGVVLYPRSGGAAVRVPFPADCFQGDLAAMKIRGLASQDWYYQFYRGATVFTDPYARRVVHLTTGDAETVGAFAESGEKPHSTPSPAERAFCDEFLYCLHVRGFTQSPTAQADRAHRGTFAGIIDKIPYLQSLGVTSVELMPVYELAEPVRAQVRDSRIAEGHDDAQRRFRSAAQSASTSPDDRPSQHFSQTADVPAARPNYWGFGPGVYFAPRAAYAAGDNPNVEFAAAVNALHAAGIGVVTQLYFPAGTPAFQMLDAARFYVRTYGVDGLHLIGENLPLRSFAEEPLLARTALYCERFPYQEIAADDTAGALALRCTDRLADYNDDYMFLLRKLVKSDDYVLADFLREFLRVTPEHGQVRYAANYNGFTLADLVAYSRKHNEANGEENRDGTNRNESWNCGAEGTTRRKDVYELRQRQMKNFLTLLFLSQGTPLLHAGDECLNSQNGNNNAYCQDNETGWVRWRQSAQAQEMTELVRALAAFRRAHPVLRAREPFRYGDYRSLGFPDVSLHGREPWKPSLTPYDHTVGVMFCENYADEGLSSSGQGGSGAQKPASSAAFERQPAAEMQGRPRLLYLAINTYWKPRTLGLPTLPQGLLWAVAADTAATPAFYKKTVPLKEQSAVTVQARAVQILQTVEAVPADVSVQ